MASSVESCTAFPCSPSINVSLYSYGHANGPFGRSKSHEQDSLLLSYNIRHLPNPPRKLRAMTTGLSPRLRKEFLKNDAVETLLEKTRSENTSSIKTACDALFQENHSLENSKQHDRNHEITDTGTYPKPDIPLLVTVCCEEGRHRSVAFVEELAKRLSLSRDGLDLSHPWKLSITTSHRDLEDLRSSSELTTSQQVWESCIKSKHKGTGKDARRLNQKSRNGYDDEIA